MSVSPLIQDKLSFADKQIFSSTILIVLHRIAFQAADPARVS